MFFIGLVEDARVEYKAIQEFPGLKKLWRSLLVLESEEQAEHPTMPVLEHFALMLLDETERSDDEELNALAARRDGNTVGNPSSVGQFEHRDGHAQSLPAPDTAGAGSATLASRAGSIHARNRVSSHKPGTVATMQNRKKPSQPSHSAR